MRILHLPPSLRLNWDICRGCIPLSSEVFKDLADEMRTDSGSSMSNPPSTIETRHRSSESSRLLRPWMPEVSRHHKVGQRAQTPSGRSRAHTGDTGGWGGPPVVVRVWWFGWGSPLTGSGRGRPHPGSLRSLSGTHVLVKAVRDDPGTCLPTHPLMSLVSVVPQEAR